MSNKSKEIIENEKLLEEIIINSFGVCSESIIPANYDGWSILKECEK